MRYAVMTLLLLLLLAGPAAAQVQVDIGIHLPAPPRLVVVPGIPVVRYAPNVSANVFLYEGQPWAFANGAWYVASGYNGPWILVQPPYVPRPILRVPVMYYPVPPGHWKQWRHEQPPRWGNEWGREWAEKRHWKDQDDDDGPGKGKGKGHGKGKGKGHG